MSSNLFKPFQVGGTGKRLTHPHVRRYNPTAIRARATTSDGAEVMDDLTAAVRSMDSMRSTTASISTGAYLPQTHYKPRQLPSHARRRGPFGMQGPLSVPTEMGRVPPKQVEAERRAALGKLKTTAYRARLPSRETVDPGAMAEHNSKMKQEKFEAKKRESIARSASRKSPEGRGRTKEEQMMMLGASTSAGIAAVKLNAIRLKKAEDRSVRKQMEGLYGLDKLTALGVDMPETEGAWKDNMGVAPTFDQILEGTVVEHASRGEGVVVDIEEASKDNGGRKRIHVKFSGSSETHR